MRVATVDVHVLRRSDDSWRVLLLQRGEGTRCTGAWECVHGRIEDGELPERAARREVQEETGLTPSRLYCIGVQPFYLPVMTTVTLSVIFAAIVDGGSLTLGAEHARGEWLVPERADELMAWPRSRQALRDVLWLLRSGDAGPMEDVLRVP